MSVNPDTLLNNIRNAIALGHPAMAQLAFATLDDQLSKGGLLPTDWRVLFIDEKEAP